MKNCVSCGKDLPNELTVCPFCGEGQAIDADKLDKTKKGLLNIIDNANSGHLANTAPKAEVNTAAYIPECPPPKAEVKADNLGIPSQYVVPIVLSKAPENEVYSAVDLYGKKKRRKKKLKGEAYKGFPVLFLLLDLLIVGSLFFNYTFSSQMIRGFEPVFTLFGRGTNYGVYSALYIGKYAKFFALYKYAFAAFAAVSALGALCNLFFAGLPRAVRTVNGINAFIQLIFIAAAAVFAVLIFGEKQILKGLGILIAAALILIKIIALQVRVIKKG